MDKEYLTSIKCPVCNRQMVLQINTTTRVINGLPKVDYMKTIFYFCDSCLRNERERIFIKGDWYYYQSGVWKVLVLTINPSRRDNIGELNQ